MIELPLIRIPQDISYVGPDGSQERKKHYVLQIDMNVSLKALRSGRSLTPELINKPAPIGLPDPEDVHPEETETDPQPSTAPGPAAPPPETERAWDEESSSVSFGGEYGDLMRFNPEDRNTARKILESIKKVRAKIGDEVFYATMGSSNICDMDTIEQLANFYNFIVAQERAPRRR